jgi:hypothetical protein
MKFKVLFIFLLLCGFVQAQNFQFVKKGGGSSSDYAYSTCVDNAGNVYVTGCYKGAGTFDNINLTSKGLLDIFIAKYNSSGTLLWCKTAGGTGNDEGDRIFVTADGSVYVAGTIIGSATFDWIVAVVNGGAFAGEDLFLTKLNSQGEFQWVKTFGSPSQDWIDDVTLLDNNFYFTGHYYGTFTAGSIILNPAGTSGGYFFMRTDIDGNPVWGKNTGGVSRISSGSNRLIVAGVFGGTANFGNVTLTSNGPNDLYMGAYDLSGNQLWVKQFGGSGSENMRSIYYDRNSDKIHWAGCFQNTMTMGSSNLVSSGQYDIFVSKFDSDGNNIWAKKAGGANYDFANCTAVDDLGNMYISGYCMETSTFGTTNIVSAGQGDAYIAKYNTNGDFQWVKSGGGSGQDNGMSLIINPAGGLYLAGFFENSATFGSISLSSYGVGDAMLIKITDVTSVQNENTIIKSFKLYQNYPNPFNPSTEISFDVSKPGNVTLKVSDVSGKEVAELVNSSMNTGSYKVTFDASQLSGGIYFYTLKTPEGVDTKKMILVK